MIEVILKLLVIFYVDLNIDAKIVIKIRLKIFLLI